MKPGGYGSRLKAGTTWRELRSSLTFRAELPVPQKRNRLRDRQSTPWQPRMRRADDDMIDHAVEPRVRHRHPAVVRLGQEGGGDRIDRPVSSDHADGVVD